MTSPLTPEEYRTGLDEIDRDLLTPYQIGWIDGHDAGLAPASNEAGVLDAERLLLALACVDDRLAYDSEGRITTPLTQRTIAEMIAAEYARLAKEPT